MTGENELETVASYSQTTELVSTVIRVITKHEDKAFSLPLGFTGQVTLNFCEGGLSKTEKKETFE